MSQSSSLGGVVVIGLVLWAAVEAAQLLIQFASAFVVGFIPCLLIAGVVAVVHGTTETAACLRKNSDAHGVPKPAWSTAMLAGFKHTVQG